MNKTIRVSRELLERIAYIMQVDLAYLYKEEKELRALLSQPAELAAIKASEPVGWITDGYDADRSATTYSKEMAERWRKKGWDVRPIYTAPQPQPAEQHSDPIQSIATQLGITTFGDGLLTKIRETIDLLQSDANNLNQFREITAEQYGHLSAATKLNEALQSELNEKRETICRLLIELDAVPKIPCVSAMAKALSDKHADEAGVNRAYTWKQYSQEYIEDVEYMLATAPHVSLTDEGKSGDDMRISLISDEKIGEVTCSEHPDAPHGFNRNASHCADRYVCDCEGWVPTDEGKS